MKPWQSVVRYCAIALAVILIVNIAVWGLRIFGLVLGVASSGTYDEAKVYEFDTDTDRFDIDISAANLNIRYEKVDKITVKIYLKNVTVNESFGKLRIDERNRWFSAEQTDSWVEIMLPEGMTLRELDLDLGAGKALVSSVGIEHADIDGGAGELLINHCTITELDLDMGVGKLDFRGRITDKAEFSLGIGESDFIFTGTEDDYRFSIDRGIGSISVEGKEIGNGSFGNGTVRVDIDGGVGSISVRFLEENDG